MRVGAIDEMQIGMANANGNGTHQHFPWAGFADADVFDGQWRTGFVKYGSFHILILLLEAGIGW
ncbi:hypothetical protein D3C75_1151930 [compost metagenome]